VDAELANLHDRGVAIVVATRDDEMRPEIVRAWGIEVADDGMTARLCVSASRDSRTMSNLAGNGAIAVTMVLPSTYLMIQMKGHVTEIGEPTAAQLERVDAHVAAFVAEVEPVGLPAELARRYVHYDFIAITVAVRERYDQTPGPHAGARV
jgi:hypothetical protein